ncbi:MAG: hypothetical protein ACOYXM_00545 [Actinomycetota bacterium]
MAAPSARLVGAINRPLPAAAALLAIYVALSLCMDPGGYLGTDTGAKVATLEAMDRSGSARPDVGYWAEQWDPVGEVHPLYQSKRLDDGSWVAVTTLPMLEAALPLYAVGGYRAALLLPMLGAIGCAAAARALARRLGHPDGWLVFWVVGLGSPLALYAIDFWEHSLGAAAVLTAVVLLLDVVERRASWWQPIVAGLLLGGAAALRTEAIVYALTAVGTVTTLMALRWRELTRSITVGAAAVAGFGVAWAANRALEIYVGGASRTQRATGAATSATRDAAGRAGDRLNEGLVTLLGMKGDTASSWVIGIGVVGALLMAVRADRKGDALMTKLSFVLAGAVYLAAVLTDFAFIPGLIPAFPLALAAFGVRRRQAHAIVLSIATIALPIVWAFQFVGGAGPQWGGRYTLSSSLLLGVLGIVALSIASPTLRRGFIGLSSVLAVTGIVWVGVRTRSVDELFDDLGSVEADVLIMRDAFLLREGGPILLDRHWLTSAGEDQFARAIEVAVASGARVVAVVEPGGASAPPSVIPTGWVEEDRMLFDLTGEVIGVVTYRVP